MAPKIFFNANAAAVFFLERYAVAVLYRYAQHFARIDWGYTMPCMHLGVVLWLHELASSGKIWSIIAIQKGK
jgi:hypothetical protein